MSRFLRSLAFVPGAHVPGVFVLAAMLLVVCLPAARAAVKVQDVTSKTGITAWLVEDHSIPVISLKILFKGGASLDPQGKEGLAYMVSGLLDEGAGDMDSASFQERLADLSVSLSFAADLDSFSGSLKTLSKNRDEAFSLLALALGAPRFDDEPVSRVRSQLFASLAMSEEDPDSIAGKAWYRSAFPGHPYGRATEGTRQSLSAISQDDLHSFVAGRLGRDVLYVGVAGDITPEQLAPLLDATFSGLPAVSPSAGVGEVIPQTGGLMVIEKDIPQSIVHFGHKGLKRNDPDFEAARLLNHILGGGGLGSRLMTQVREKRGLAYSVYSYLAPFAHSGLVSGGVGTRNAQVAETLKVINAEWQRLAEEGVTAQELADAKTYLTGSFPLKMTSTGRLASLMVTLQYFDLGIDYLDRRDGLINAVTLEGTRRVAKELFDAGDLLTVVVGNPQGVTPTRDAPPEMN